ncbi:MAG: tautomerase family protein [Deltaproteobacteria bacterium]|nr:tautomerase family protein [Deltaproteobacteria bacterium]
MKITKEDATLEQKAQLIGGATDMHVDMPGKNPTTTVVAIDEVDTDNCGVAGATMTARRKGVKEHTNAKSPKHSCFCSIPPDP